METNIFVFLVLEMGEFFGESLNEYYENRQRKKQREKKNIPTMMTTGVGIG